MKQEGNLIVDGVSNSTVSPKKADILDVVGMLYVGGLPINYTTRRIGPVSKFVYLTCFKCVLIGADVFPVLFCLAFPSDCSRLWIKWTLVEVNNILSFERPDSESS